MIKAQRISKQGQLFKHGWQLGLCGLQNKECLYHISIMYMLNVILKIVKASLRDVFMKETHMKETHETKNDKLVFKGQNLMG